MSVKTLLNIVLKALGIIFLRDFISIAPSFLSVFSSLINFSEGITPLISSFLSVVAYGAIAYLLIFRTGWFIEKMKLDEDIEESNVSFDINPSTLLTICLIIIASVLILDAVPYLLRELYLYFDYIKGKSNYLATPQPDYTYMIIYIGKIIIGLLILGYLKRIVEYFEPKVINETEEQVSN
jgi:hypothetical protein